jgi:uncharacterized protein
MPNTGRVPANLTPVYRSAEARFKAATGPDERVEALEEMLRVIPRHKGTDHLRGALRRKLSQLRDEQRIAAKKGGGRVDPGHVPRQGTGQIVLLGPANGGKSALLAALTNAEPVVAEYPYTTQRPQPGMMRCEGVTIQLVDGPAVEPAVYQPWMNTLLRNADIGLVVVDPSMTGVLGVMETLQELVARARLDIVPAWWALGENRDEDAADEDVDGGEELDDESILARLEPGDVELPVLMVASKSDVEGNDGDFEVLEELLGDDWPMLSVSATSGQGLDALRRAVFSSLQVIRVYAKPPGQAPSLGEPIVLPRGSTVADMARAIHREIAADLRYARIWSDRHHDGQRIPQDQQLRDGDVVEIHA